IALFYMQGINTTAVHAHGATFGVYGMLSLGLILLIVQTSFKERIWNHRFMSFAFWGLNVGLALMILLSLLPIGLIQAHASITTGLWYARGSDLMQSELIQKLRWARAIGDIVFTMGAISLGLAILDRTGLIKIQQTETNAHLTTEDLNEEILLK
ncbi:MAG: cbb3-type cytochrome c oxidase subunit I, partial [Bdellovibrionales bacterium]|nr:cbb3-type cytochrome c oxidase subunit I [Bdellovibrionales bacterium]